MVTALGQIAAGCACDHPSIAKDLTSVEEALRAIDTQTCSVATNETIPLTAARDRILAQPIIAQIDLPPFDNSGMDGYAINTSALAGPGPWDLPVTQRLPAGTCAKALLAPNEAVRIFAGAPVPSGADTVVMQERVERHDNSIRVSHRPQPGENIRRAGEDMARGQTILETGTKLSARAIAAAAATGISVVTVRRPVHVALVISGDEVVQNADSRKTSEIWDVNTPMLDALITRPGVSIVASCHVADDADETRKVIRDCADQADLIISTGGISVGEEDHVKPSFVGLGAELFFSGVAVKPGKPVTFGRLGSAYWLGLPGNPHSAYAIWHLFGTSILDKLMGVHATRPGTWPVKLANPIRRKPGRSELRPACLCGTDNFGPMRVTPASGVHSGRITELALMDGHILLPSDARYLPSGAVVQFQPYENRER